MKTQNSAKATISLLALVILMIQFGCKKDNDEVVTPDKYNPVCKITSPGNGDQFLLGKTVRIVVDAKDGDGQISSVDFYINGIGAGSASSFPYIFNWNTGGEVTGTYLIKAVATDNDGSTYSDSLTVSLFWGEGQPCPGTPTVVDADGNVYNTVLIGDQCWMAENLRVGTVIPGSQDQADNGVVEKWYYDDNPANGQYYGALYQWNELMRYSTKEASRGICPQGWHIPSDDEFSLLEACQDTQYGNDDPIWQATGFRGYDAGKNMKSSSDWTNNGNGANSLNFNALPGGYLSHWNQAVFAKLGEQTVFWTSTQVSLDNAFERVILSGKDGVERREWSKDYGYAVRCIKDEVSK